MTKHRITLAGQAVVLMFLKVLEVNSEADFAGQELARCIQAPGLPELCTVG